MKRKVLPLPEIDRGEVTSNQMSYACKQSSAVTERFLFGVGQSANGDKLQTPLYGEQINSFAWGSVAEILSPLAFSSDFRRELTLFGFRTAKLLLINDTRLILNSTDVEIRVRLYTSYMSKRQHSVRLRKFFQISLTYLVTTASVCSHFQKQV